MSGSLFGRTRWFRASDSSHNTVIWSDLVPFTQMLRRPHGRRSIGYELLLRSSRLDRRACTDFDCDAPGGAHEEWMLSAQQQVSQPVAGSIRDLTSDDQEPPNARAQ
jgi:hypothetical protein